jgi:hypothetical protein
MMGLIKTGRTNPGMNNRLDTLTTRAHGNAVLLNANADGPENRLDG